MHRIESSAQFDDHAEIIRRNSLRFDEMLENIKWRLSINPLSSDRKITLQEKFVYIKTWFDSINQQDINVYYVYDDEKVILLDIFAKPSRF